MDNAGKKQLIFYMHAGSGNHGCEAIAYSTMKLLEEPGSSEKQSVKPVIATNSKSEDEAYQLGTLSSKNKISLIEERHIARHKITHILYYIYRKITGDAESFYRYRYADVIGNISESGIKTAVSIGGDNYCYPEMVKDLVLSHNVFKELGMKTVLMGCSVEPETVPGLILDLNSYDMIIARESITYEGLVKGGISENKLRLCPDPAFTLPVAEIGLPSVFAKRKVIGLNVSPMVQGKESGNGITMDNYRELIKHILDKTDYGIALIPHVVWKNNDDRIPLGQLYDEFEEYHDRITLVTDNNACVLKYIIGKCYAFVGARTHSTIAAYSQCVPTLVLGYSVKSRGIALDLFGTDDKYVIPVQSLKNKDDLTGGFEWLLDNRDKIKNILNTKMPEYIARSKGNVCFVSEL